VAEQPVADFASLLRQLRAEAKLTQKELAEATALSLRLVSDLERGVNRTAHKDTPGLLADALSPAGPVRGVFVTSARGRIRPERCWPSARRRSIRPPEPAAPAQLVRGPGGRAH
jgi:transcriptional regulator with XRE-family HTH domain